MKNFIDGILVITFICIIIGGIFYLDHKNFMDTYFYKPVYIPSINMNGIIIDRRSGKNYKFYIIQLNNGNTISLPSDEFVLGESK